MSKFKPFPELVIIPQEDGDVSVGTIRTAAGDDFMTVVVQRSPEDTQRFVDCWNACRKIAFPAAHIAATDETVQRLEGLRKEAWARAVELGANDFRGSESPDLLASMAPANGRAA
jgi:hypothetical protein